MKERSPQQILEQQELQKNEPFWLLPQSGFYEGIYGHSSLVFVAVKTYKHTQHEARISVKTNDPYELADAFASAFQIVLKPDFQLVGEISIGKINFGMIGNNGETKESATVLMIRNGDVTTRMATGETQEQALMNAIFAGFKGMVQR